ncbi:MAG TPA: electron transport complex subunit RsxC [Leucothrix mucor]|uniref:Ion-translocating oxidoreductase complex subunit C n=1 Tax=Leucothrix mucor TaxID=45248 RepID=A0A7V2SYZ1_LEUMU|nr:electron transport complex subunit RsxC [Leucothrix mucor]
MKSERKIWTFHGGVHPEFNKEQSTTCPISTVKLPKRLIIPVQQHIGAPTEVLVASGEQVFKGQLIAKMADGQLGASIHAPSSGIIGKIEKQAIPHPSALDALCIELILDGKDNWGDCRLPPYIDFAQIDNERLLKRIDEAGLVGLGGAAFPSYVKVSSSTKHQIETLVINGAECEPYISCDDLLMRERADEIVTGIRILLQLLKPQQCLVGIEDNKPEAISAMQRATESLDKVHICAIPTLYPSGGEKQLIKILTGKEVPAGDIPLDLDILCHNIATTYALYKAVVKGEPLISRVLTITGDGVKQPQNMEALIGTPISDLIEQAGGYTANAQRLIMGGPMMGIPLKNDNNPMVKASNCFLVASVTSLQQAHSIHASQPQMPCIRCGQCMQVCPAELLPQQLYWHTQAKDFERVTAHNLNSCIECGCCDFVCPSHIPLVSYFRFAKSEIHVQEVALKKSDLSRKRHEFLEFRKAREKQEREEKRRKHKEALQKKKAAMAAKKKVAGEKVEDDPKAAAIKAALARTKAKKAERARKIEH